MGLIQSLRGKRVYFDTNIFIYLIEGNVEHQNLLNELFEALDKGQFTVFTSYLTLTELLPPLVRRGDKKVLEGTLEFIRESGLFELALADEEIFLQAGVLRGELGMKTPDALHVATAIYRGCNVFLTNDAGIRVPKGMKRILLSDCKN